MSSGLELNVFISLGEIKRKENNLECIGNFPFYFFPLHISSSLPLLFHPLFTAASYKVVENCMAHKAMTN